MTNAASISAPAFTRATLVDRHSCSLGCRVWSAAGPNPNFALAGIAEAIRALRQWHTRCCILRRHISPFVHEFFEDLINTVPEVVTTIMTVASTPIASGFTTLVVLVFGRILPAAVFYCLVKFLYQAVYYRFFHELSKFPGPFWASATRLYITYWNLKETEHVHMLHLHQKYGTVLRVHSFRGELTPYRASRENYTNAAGRQRCD